MAVQYAKYPHGRSDVNTALSTSKAPWYFSSRPSQATASYSGDGSGVRVVILKEAGSSHTYLNHKVDEDWGTNRVAMPTTGRWVAGGIQIRRNSPVGKGGDLSEIKLSVWDDNANEMYTTVLFYLDQSNFPVGKWVTLPNIFNTFNTNQAIQSVNVQFHFRTGNTDDNTANTDFNIRNCYIYRDTDYEPHSLVAGDASFSYTTRYSDNQVVFTHSDPSNLVSMLRWNFGDGSPELYDYARNLKTVTHTYSTHGNYNVTVTAMNAKSNTISSFGSYTASINETVTKVGVAIPPKGVIEPKFISQVSYLNVEVDANSTVYENPSIAGVYTWDWGDGSPTTTGKTSSHTYASGGGYPVKLTVTNSLGQSKSITKTVVATDIPSTNVNFNVVVDLLKVRFVPTYTGSSQTWQFGDGKTSTSVEPSHTYEVPGSYEVTLQQTIGGTTGSVTKTVTVVSAYKPIEKFSDALRLEIAKIPAAGELVNNIKNPNGTLGGYGWITPTATGKVSSSSTSHMPNDKNIDGWKLIFTSGGGAPQTFNSELFKVSAGKYVQATWQVPYIDGWYRAFIRFYDSTGTMINDSTFSPYYQAAGGSKVLSSAALAPAGTVYASIWFAHYANSAGANPAANSVLIFRRVSVSVANTAAALNNYTYRDPYYWEDVIQPAFEIGISREEFNVGLMQCSIRDGNYDPARYDVIRPGQPIRLRAATRDSFGNEKWESIYTGEISNALVEYDRPKINFVPGIPEEPVRTVATNYCVNPSFHVNTTGWLLSAAETYALDTTIKHSGTQSFRFGRTTPGSMTLWYNYQLGLSPVVPGETCTVGIWVYSDVAGDILLYTQMYDSAQATVVNVATTCNIPTANQWTFIKADPLEAPSGSAFVGFTVARFASVGNIWVDDAFIFKGDPIVFPDYFDGNTPDDEEYNYEWAGEANVSFSTKKTIYVPGVPDEYIAEDDPERTVIKITAIDNISLLSQTPEPRGIFNVYELPYILEGKNVPYIINNSSDQVTSAQIVAINDNASLIDQVSITRDTKNAYAFVNRNNVLIVNDPLNMTTGEVTTLDEATYSEVDVSFNTDQCINQVMVKFLRHDGETEETVEVPYGPYKNETSIEKWGLHTAEFTIQGIVENSINIAAFAQTVLDKNSIPVTRVNSVNVPIVYDNDISESKAILDLYDLANIKYSGSGIDENSRISSITHVINTSSWWMSLGFSVDGAVASPQVTPSPPVTVPTITGTAEAGFVTMYAGDVSKIPTGWLVCNGTSRQRSAYPELFATIGTTYGSDDSSSFKLPNFSASFPRGNTRAASGGSDTHDHTMGAHTHDLSTSANAQLGGAAIRNNAANTGAMNSGSSPTGTSSNVPSYVGVIFIIKT